ncbi:MAG: glycosyltransferase family 4 protein [Geminicoccaceae bacterium]
MTTPTRILYIGILPPRTGGASISFGQILGGLGRAGIEICAIAPMTETMYREEGDWYAAQNPQLRVFRYLVPFYNTESYKPIPPDLAAAREQQIPRLARELQTAFRPDLVMAWEAEAPLVRPLADEFGLPLCLLLRGSPTAQILAGTFTPDRAEEYLRCFRSADRSIAVARYLADGLERQHGIAGVRTIPNALDLDAFAPRPRPQGLAAELGVQADAQTVLVPANLISRKRPLDVLRAATRVIRANPRALFLLAGGGAMREEAGGLADLLGLFDHVRFLGWVPNARMPALYNLADVVVMTSEAEGMARAYLETMASGRPLIASDIASARELVREGETGLLFPVGDDAALAERILHLLGDPDRRRRMGDAARASVANRRIEHAVAAYKRELEEFVATTRR